MGRSNYHVTIESMTHDTIATAKFVSLSGARLWLNSYRQDQRVGCCVIWRNGRIIERNFKNAVETKTYPTARMRM